LENTKIKITYNSANDSLIVAGIPAYYRIIRDEKKPVSKMGEQQEFSLASPVFNPNIPSLRGPSYPILPLSIVRQENAKAKLLFDKTDPVGDDRGQDNRYEYPTNINFVSGILDLTRAVVRYDTENFYITLHFKELHNPGWHPEYGFQLTFAAIAIDRGNGKGSSAIGVNSNYITESFFKFDRLIAIGGGIHILDESGSILCEYLPRPEDAKNPIGDISKKLISFSIPLSYIGKPSGAWKMLILAGAQDDHGGAGVGEFRTVDKNSGEWIGGGKTDPAMPNVYDTMILKKW
jgi:carbohydrate-binding DOMON domain-containing protein